MRENYKFRIAPTYAQELLGPDCEKVRNPVTDEEEYFVDGVVGDAQYQRILEADQALAAVSKKSLLVGWDSRFNRRVYTSSEIRGAQLLLLHLFPATGAGEEFGTWYTEETTAEECRARESGQCAHSIKGCALSSKQVGPLHMPSRKMRKGADIFMLWGGEYIVSDALAKLIQKFGLTGAQLIPIWNTSTSMKSLRQLSRTQTGAKLLNSPTVPGGDPDSREFRSWLEQSDQLPLLERALWEQMEARPTGSAPGEPAPNRGFFQLVVHSRPIEGSAQTRFGENPLRPGSGLQCKCEFGRIAGKRLLSALIVETATWDGSDVCTSDVFLGGRQGLFRPWRLLLVSKRLFDLMQQHGMKGFDFEVVQMI